MPHRRYAHRASAPKPSGHSSVTDSVAGWKCPTRRSTRLALAGPNRDACRHRSRPTALSLPASTTAAVAGIDVDRAVDTVEGPDRAIRRCAQSTRRRFAGTDTCRRPERISTRPVIRSTSMEPSPLFATRSADAASRRSTSPNATGSSRVHPATIVLPRFHLDDDVIAVLFVADVDPSAAALSRARFSTITCTSACPTDGPRSIPSKVATVHVRLA